MADGADAINSKSAADIARGLRAEFCTLYDLGVHPIRTAQAMLYGLDGEQLTDGEILSGVWFGISDILDRGDVEMTLRNQLFAVRESLAASISAAHPGFENVVRNYRETTSRMNEMKLLQAYKPKLIDATGNMQLEAVQNMLDEIEYDRANNPGSLAQDISEEGLRRLYLLRDSFADPSLLPSS